MVFHHSYFSKPLEGFPKSDHWPRLLSPDESFNTTKSKEMNPTKGNPIIDNAFDKTCDGFWDTYYN